MTKSEFFHNYTPATLNEALLRRLRGCIVHHPMFANVLDKVLTHVQLGDPSRIFLVIGAAGTGKSTLSKAAHTLVAKWAAGKDDVSSPLWVEAPPPEGSSYSFRPFYEELLFAMKEPLPGYKLDPKEARKRRKKRKKCRAIRSTSGARQYLKNTLRGKSVPVIFVDEAQHFGRSANITERIDAMDVIKSITELNETKMVFFGTHEARKLQDLNGQLSRRVKTEYFTPYELVKSDYADFYSTYASLCTDIMLPIEVGREHARFLHENTLGAIGLLSQWLQDAVITAISNKDSVVTIDHLADNTPEAVTLDLIRKESAEYQMLRDTRSRRIQRQLETARKRSRPGRRKPSRRDPVGGAMP